MFLFCSRAACSCASRTFSLSLKASISFLNCCSFSASRSKSLSVTFSLDSRPAKLSFKDAIVFSKSWFSLACDASFNAFSLNSVSCFSLMSSISWSLAWTASCKTFTSNVLSSTNFLSESMLFRWSTTSFSSSWILSDLLLMVSSRSLTFSSSKATILSVWGGGKGPSLLKFFSCMALLRTWTASSLDCKKRKLNQMRTFLELGQHQQQCSSRTTPTAVFKILDEVLFTQLTSDPIQSHSYIIL